MPTRRGLKRVELEDDMVVVLELEDDTMVVVVLWCRCKLGREIREDGRWDVEVRCVANGSLCILTSTCCWVP